MSNLKYENNSEIFAGVRIWADFIYFFHKFIRINLIGRRPYRKTTSQEDDITGRLPQRKKKSLEHDLANTLSQRKTTLRRRPYRKTVKGKAFGSVAWVSQPGYELGPALPQLVFLFIKKIGSK